MSTIDYDSLQAQVYKKLDSYITRFYNDVPMATYQRDSQTIDKKYFIRHTIETILRIRYKRTIDALVIHYFTKNNLRLAKAWANYTDDEMLHGNMFAKDLGRLAGLTPDEIYDYEPLFSTQLLNGYFYFTLETEGPMAAIASAMFLEYTTRHTQPDWLDNLEKIFGKEMVRGARAHVAHDIADDHSDFVWKVLKKLINNEEDKQRLWQHLERIYSLFVAYFNEINQCFFDKDSIQINNNAAIAAINNIYTVRECVI